MQDRIKQRILHSLGWSKETLDKLIEASPDNLHDPFLYTNMETLVDKLYQFKQVQDLNPDKLVVLDTDYDTDGIMSACVLTAALSVFNINHRIYIPSMDDGYGLSPKAVDDMLKIFKNVSLILTADNGTNAYDGVDYANSKGIPVLVTDHHIGSHIPANAEVIVNPNTPTDFYPFKGNAGATVAWKTMMAYAKKYKPEVEPLIYDLIVFAGIANVADVMPIVDENHFMVREAIQTLNQLQAHKSPKKIGIRGYDTVMEGLYDLITQMQLLRDQDRQLSGKKPSALPTDEQLIGWYISPLLNAPRRVVGTPTSAFKGLCHSDKATRIENIKTLVEQNKAKTKLRDDAIQSVDANTLKPHSNVIHVYSQHGIAGLVASHFASNGNPTIVFATSKNLSPDSIIGGSARSEVVPLPLVIEMVEKLRPGTVVGGGGHAHAAGYSIRYKDIDIFRELFDEASATIYQQILLEANNQPQLPIIQNKLTFAFYDGHDSDESLWYNIHQDSNFANELMNILNFFDLLKPFGKGFEAETKFEIHLDPYLIQQHQLNLDFWGGRTFKANVHGVDILTFDKELADTLKTKLKSNDYTVLICTAELKKNEFLGKVTPQLVLSAK